jgi:mono/diheme cytochrome c family protein
MIKRGEYLATVGDCVACHTTPGGKPFAGGLYMETPFGKISTPNITPDKATGIGDWSNDDFYRALHEGIGKDKEYLYPVFPFPWYTKATRDDVMAIKAYLFSLPPENAPRKPLKLAFPFNIREGLLAWRTAFFKAGTFEPDAHASDEINHGAYLVEGLGHCGECHNHNNLFGASSLSGPLTGGKIEGWYAPNITSDGREGIGSWSKDQIAAFLKSGASPVQGVALGPMRETIDDSLSHLSDPDLQAMAAYLKSTQAKETYKPYVTPAVTKDHTTADAYLNHCAFCHGLDGKGITGAVPALAGNGVVKAEGAQDMVRVVLGGKEASNGFAPMPAVGAGMTDQEVADAINYARESWDNAAPEVGAGTVADERTKIHTFMAGDLHDHCPPIGDKKLAQIIDQSGVKNRLKNLGVSDLLDRTDSLLTELKATGASDDEVVNAMTEAYCPIALANTTVPKSERIATLGSFSDIVYEEVKNLDRKKTTKLSSGQTAPVH